MSFKVFDGSSWYPFKKIKIQTNIGWQDYKKAFIFDGSSWVEILEKPKILTNPELSYSRGQELYGAGQTVTVSNGTWEGTVSSYKYQWEKGIYSGSQILWSNIDNQTTNSFLIPGDLVGYKLRCSVIATNNAGDSEKAYGTTIGYILPQFIQTITAFVQQDGNGYINGKIRVFWDVSEGADGYILIYQGPGIPRTEKKIIGKGNNLFDWDFGANNLDDLIGLTTLGIYIGPYNDTSSAAAAYRAANGINDTQTPTYYQSASINNLNPLLPSLTATVYQNPGGVDDKAGIIDWSLINITQSRYEIYSEWPDGSLFGPFAFTTRDATSSFITNYTPGSTSGPWKVRVYGTSRGYRGTPTVVDFFNPTQEYYWESNSGSFVASSVIPVSSTAPTLTPSGDVLAGTTLTANQGQWNNTPTSYNINIVKLSPLTIVASGTTSATYTTTQQDLNDNAEFKAYATATNEAGTSLTAESATTTRCFTAATTPTGGSANIFGNGVVGTTISMSTTGWATGTATPTSYTTTLQRMNYAGGYDDMGVTSYTVQSSDLSVGSKGGTIAAIFRAKATATNAAGSSTVYSDIVQAATNQFTVPNFLNGGVPQSTSNYTIVNGGAIYSTSSYSSVGLVAAQYPTAGTSATIGTEITVYTYYYVAPAVLPSGGVATLSGSAQVGSTITASASGWSGSPTPTVATQLQRMNYAGGYDDMGVTSYTIQSSDLTVGTKGGQIAEYFRAVSRATNSAGTATVYSDAVQATAAPVAPSFPYFPTFTAPAPSFPYFPTFTAPAPSFPYFPAFKGPSFPTFTAPVAPSFPFFPTFTAPVSPSFPYFKVTKCIEANTRLLTFDRGYVAAKDIRIGDKLVSISSEDFGNETMKWFDVKNNVKLTEVEVIKSEMSVKDVLSFNEMNKYFSYGQPIFIKKDGLATWVESGAVNIGDTLLEIDPGTGDINEVIVNSIQTDTLKDVYDIRTSGNQWFIAEQFIVIS